MTGSEAIKVLGSQLYEGFDIDTEPRRTVYRKVYENFTKGLNSQQGKGIGLIGGRGVGKTALMKIMHRLFKDTSRKFVWITASKLKDLLDDYTVSEIKEMYGQRLLYDLYIDDIGNSNPNSNRYGNQVNLISELIYDRHELFLDAKIRTHFSSNLPITIDKKKHPNVPSLEDLYGDRVSDRLIEMTETIILKGESLRK